MTAARTANTFPRPEPCSFPTVNPRPLRPLETPPRVAHLPTLPSPPRKSLLDRWYTLTTHLVPAAYPRETPYIPEPNQPVWSSNKEEFKAHVQQIAQELNDNKHASWEGRMNHLGGNRKPLWTCINRYVRKGLRSGDSSGVTLFFSHANGFPKEIYEPALERLISAHEQEANYQVDEIWLWEAANHGDACLLNRENLGGIYDWRDNSRDILHFLQYYLPTTASPEPLPTHLPRVSEAEAQRRLVNRGPERNIVHIGHSFGACSVVRAALETPALFQRLYSLDAMIRPSYPDATFTREHIVNMMNGAIRRRDGWASREEAYKSFAATPFFKIWDPACLQIYVDCALYDAPEGQVKLKMSGMQEAVCFAEQNASCSTFELLAKLDERIETRWLVAAKLLPHELEMRRQVVWRRPVNSTHRIMPSGHLIAQEIPSELAEDLHEFLNSRYGSRKALL